jgi:prepilin-type N-terminal cleavage/methylation domain-containing protein
MLQKLRGNNSEGFTLIELMIVIAIIGILAAIAIPNFIAYRNKAYCSQAESDAKSIASGIADYYSEPDHTSMIDFADISAGLGGISGTISGTIDAIVVTVTDPGQCPRDTTYRITIPEDTANDGWT